MPCTPTSLSASFTSSSLKGLMMASTFFKGTSRAAPGYGLGDVSSRFRARKLILQCTEASSSETPERLLPQAGLQDGVGNRLQSAAERAAADVGFEVAPGRLHHLREADGGVAG